MQIAANASVNNNLSMWATSAPAPQSAQPASDPLSPQDTVTLSNPPDTPEHAPTFAPADIEPDMRAGTAGPYNPSVQTELKKEDHFLDKQQSEGRHFVKLDQDGSRIGFASKNINGDNVLYTGQATGNAGMMVDGMLKYDKADDGHITRTSYQTTRPVLMQFSQNSDGTLQSTNPPSGAFTAVRVDR